jgi:phosphatidylglycerophosphatase A
MTAAVGIATLGPVGYWPVGPGTLASALVGLLWRVLPWPWTAWVALLLVLSGVGTVAAGRAERALGHDDRRIVIDEAVGMGIALLAAPRTWAGAAIAFALFRLFDIVKPPPLGRLQQAPAGWGIMLDDIGAGLVAAGLLRAGLAIL